MATQSILAAQICTTSLQTTAPKQPCLNRRAAFLREQPRFVPSASASGSPNTLLKEPDNLWEIGGPYWWPFDSFTPPAHLDGSLPGDRGFDPFSLGTKWGLPPVDQNSSDYDDARLRWLLEGELYNGRVAMLGVVGVLTVEVQGKGPWWEIPGKLDYFGFPYVSSVVVAHVLFAVLEKKRLENFRETGEAGHFGAEPTFDPFGLTEENPLGTDYNRQAEVRNCRLAMLTFLGFAVQAWVTGKGPLENASDHLRDPFGANIFTYGDRGTNVVGVFAAISAAVHIAELTRGREESRGGGGGGGGGRRRTISNRSLSGV